VSNKKEDDEIEEHGFTVADHKKHCEIAQCKHDAIHNIGNDDIVFGWCDLCRKVAFSPEKVFTN
jgi:hypothetical protein